MSHIRWYPLVMRNVRAAGRARMPAFIPRLTELEDRTLLATIVVDPVPGAGAFTTIQAAVNAANTAGGDTIQIHPATYTEQVTINKSLTMLGTGPGAIIQAPSTLTTDLGQNALVEIGNGATVNMSDLTLEGPAPPTSTLGIAGIYVVGGATANVTGTTIDKIRNEPLNGIQFGRAILVGSTAQNQVGHATITDCTITDYQKSGIITGGNGTTVTITGTTITGVGPTAAIAQNGITILPGTTAVVNNNTITGNQYTGTSSLQPSGPDPLLDVQSVGILNIGSDSVSVAGNTVTGNDIGIYNNGTGTAISGNTVQGNRFEGILLEQGTATVSDNTITGSNIGVAVIAFAGNTADSQGTLVSNTITDNGNGGLAFPGGGIRLLAGPGATTTAQATAHFNRIVGNFVGLDNTTNPTVDAKLNWWGGNSGPNATDGNKANDKTSGAVNTTPWLVMSLSASLAAIGSGGTTPVTADLTKDSSGATHSTPPFFPDHTPIAFSATGGTITPSSAPTQSGSASSSFTSTTPGTASASVTLDNQTLSTPITIQPINVTPPPTTQQTTAGQPFSQSVAVTGGAGGFVYTVSAGQAPPGLALDPNTGLLSGLPTTPGIYAFTVKATDLSAASVSESLTIVVNPSVAINPNTPPQGTVGAPYADQLSETGGTGTLTFALAGGTTLPPGLSLSNRGLITGTPTTAGTFPFTVTATDQKGASASLPLSIVVVPAQVAAPIVQSLQRFGFHAQPTIYVLTFSTALDPARAQDVTNYRLTPIFGRRLGRDIPITAAIYDPVAHTVTLQPAVRVYLFGHYRLAVNGSTPTGVAGATGLLLDGQGTGLPGTDFVTTFGKEILAGPNFPDPTAGRPAHHRSLPKTPHAVPHLQTTSTAASTTHALSVTTVDAVLGTVVVPKKHKK